jgi:hypothetical protein
MLPDIERSPLSGRRLTLSKSKLMSFEQCPKKLWLQVHRPQEARLDEATLTRFAAGHRVGELARLTEPDGILVDTGTDVEAALAATNKLLASIPAKPIFEAAFRRDGVVVRADILKPVDASGLDWDLIEVKNTRRPRSHQIRDVATQAWVASAAIQLRQVVLRHVTRFVRARQRFSADLFASQDVTNAARALYKSRAAVAASASITLRSSEPTIQRGPQCAAPYLCEFRQYCREFGGG